MFLLTLVLHPTSPSILRREPRFNQVREWRLDACRAESSPESVCFREHVHKVCLLVCESEGLHKGPALAVPRLVWEAQDCAHLCVLL